MNELKNIRDYVKNGLTVFGYRKTLKMLKNGEIKKIILAKNAPEDIKKDLEYNCKIAKIEFSIADKTSVELGTICGKPFPIAVIGIKR